MTPYWFPVPGRLGIGVTAEDQAEATALATEVALRLGWPFDPRLVEQNVDVSTLDPRRIQPLIGRVDVPGVWFPPPPR